MIFSGNSDELHQFVTDNNKALVALINNTNFRKWVDMKKQIVIGVMLTDDEVNSKAILNDLKTVAQNEEELSSKFAFSWIDGVKWNTFLTQFDIEQASPMIFVLDPSKKIYWKDENISDVKTFLNALLSGEIIPREQKPPKKDGTVKHSWDTLKGIYNHFKPWSYIIYVFPTLFVVQFIIAIVEVIIMKRKEAKRKSQMESARAADEAQKKNE